MPRRMNMTIFDRGSRVRYSALGLQVLKTADRTHRGSVVDITGDLVQVRWDHDQQKQYIRSIYLAYAFQRLPNDPKEFVCTCRRKHKFGPYVFKHWDEDLVFTCKCGKKYKLNSGKAVLI